MLYAASQLTDFLTCLQRKEKAVCVKDSSMHFFLCGCVKPEVNATKPNDLVELETYITEVVQVYPPKIMKRAIEYA